MAKLFGRVINLMDRRAFSSGSRTKTAKGLKPLPLMKASIIPPISENAFGNDFQKVMNFLNRVTGVLGVTIPRPEIVETTKNTSHAMYEVLAHNTLEVSDNFKFIFKEEYVNHLGSLTYFGRAKSITEARQKALFHLGECLYSSLKAVDLFLPTTDHDPKKVLPFIKCTFTDAQRTEISQFVTECSEEKDIDNDIDVDIDNNMPIFNSHGDEKYSVIFDSKVSNNQPRPEPLLGKLPIYRHYQEIVESIEKNQVTIVSATTGSGKTTQIPKFILHHFQSEKPSIIVTQPRRVAAISLAGRVAHELGERQVGGTVGYSVRFDTVLPDPNQSNILFCTSGLLIKKLQSMNDDTMKKCTHLILDEIHERDINTDILLLAVRRLLGSNKRLKVLIMSATLDAEKFHNYFSETGQLTVGNPVKIETSTNFPVSAYHLEDVIGALRRKNMYPQNACSQTKKFIEKEVSGDESLPETVPVELISHMAKCLHESKPEGSILCFLPGWEDIVAVKNDLEIILSRSRSPFKIYCIHSSAPPEVTQSIFRSTEGERKIILATNIAESSITIPDVAYVIDSGKQKINMYNPALRMNSLKTTWISKSNSIQRLGRVGRTQPGEYYLCCSKDRLLSPSLQPEILRVGLEDVCLSIKGLGFGGPLKEIVSELLDKPNKIALRDAVNRLIQLDALEPETENITELGLGKALVLSHVLGCSKDVLTVSAGVGERILRIPRFDDEKEQFMDFLRIFRNNYEDDHDLLLELFDQFRANRLGSSFSQGEVRFISNIALKRVSKVRYSLESQLRQLLPNSPFLQGASDPNLLKLLTLSAFYPDLAFKMGKRNHYLLPGGISAESQKESMQFVESLESVLLNRKNHIGINTNSASAQALVFEELFDVGHSMIVKSCKVDPLFSVLFAGNVLVCEQNIVVDNWIRIRSDDQESLKLLIELRQLWKYLTRKVFSSNDSRIISKLNHLLSIICKLWDPKRSIEIK